MFMSDLLVTRLRFNAEENNINEIIEKCRPVLDEYYSSVQPKPTNDREKCLALQIALGDSWIPHPEDQKYLLEILFLEQRGNIYFPNKQIH